MEAKTGSEAEARADGRGAGNHEHRPELCAAGGQLEEDEGATMKAAPLTSCPICASASAQEEMLGRKLEDYEIKDLEVM